MVTELSGIIEASGKKITAAVILLLSLFCLTAQDHEYKYFYRVYFADKGENEYHAYTPGDLLSERSLARRMKSGINVTEDTDIPVSKEYVETISSMGYSHHSSSRWMNTALFRTVEPADTGKLLELEFVNDVICVKRPAGKSNFADKLDLTITEEDVLPYQMPVAMLNGTAIHNSGFYGEGVLIAVLDGGFYNADLISSLYHLRKRGGIKATYDFVMRNPFVYGYHTHGTAVLSIIGGKENQWLAGSAPEADFLLLRTEDGNSEFPVEEDYWVAGAELADSLGADIISSSLGYSVFDDPLMNYTYSSMDGNTAYITRAAEIAASKGILVVNSAGNERNKEWKYITAPSDGNNVLATGAVDPNRTISAFSSSGPSYDRRIKPDVTAQGVSVPLQRTPQVIEAGSGTSFSCPVISGLCACLLQAVPAATYEDVIHAVRRSADRYLTPDSLYGYGIPDMTAALSLLQETLVGMPDNESLVSPNPFTRNVEITFRENPGRLNVEIITSSGRLVARNTYKDYVSRKVTVECLQNAPQGIYFIRLTTAAGTFTHKVIKIRQ